MADGPRHRVGVPILRVTANPFHVLCLSVDASADDVERRAEAVLREIDAGTPGAETYVTPLGRRTRTRELVRWACKQLRDPDRRLHHEVWFLEPVDRPFPHRGTRPEAWRAFGWRAP
jgi:hypothetical protein